FWGRWSRSASRYLHSAGPCLHASTSGVVLDGATGHRESVSRTFDKRDRARITFRAHHEETSSPASPRSARGEPSIGLPASMGRDGPPLRPPGHASAVDPDAVATRPTWRTRRRSAAL